MNVIISPVKTAGRKGASGAVLEDSLTLWSEADPTRDPPLPQPPETALHKPHPADELAEIRSEIARLKRREGELRHLLLQRPDLAQQGRWTRVEITSLQQSRFLPTLLPAAILHDPQYRRARTVQILRCLPPPSAPLAPRPGWPIRREGAALH